eukprot:m51a1_g2461 hypothetical protein (244) ;mRNA; f:21112-21843
MDEEWIPKLKARGAISTRQCQQAQQPPARAAAPRVRPRKPRRTTRQAHGLGSATAWRSADPRRGLQHRSGTGPARATTPVAGVRAPELLPSPDRTPPPAEAMRESCQGSATRGGEAGMPEAAARLQALASVAEWTRDEAGACGSGVEQPARVSTRQTYLGSEESVEGKVRRMRLAGLDARRIGQSFNKPELFREACSAGLAPTPKTTREQLVAMLLESPKYQARAAQAADGSVVAWESVVVVQ